MKKSSITNNIISIVLKYPKLFEYSFKLSSIIVSSIVGIASVYGIIDLIDDHTIIKKKHKQFKKIKEGKNK